ncbi:Dihydroanticapsin 7-dehydrogenase [Gordonia insulae]|uniref:Dihydroanticapsin 7-dehydrogenase n=2 Tax=Gordonia insulae TaxID=2420509 RepID=A0A3G8JLJ2_9ACTN|nr:Dihydroanticapsin 7-dehydrogenase [Gordonia insulae]
MGEQLEGKTALITGAGGALGAAIASRFADESIANLVLVDMTRHAAEHTRAALPSSVKAECIAVDVTDGPAVEDAVRQTVETFGALDVYVNTAGVVSPNARIHNLEFDDWNRTLAVNLNGTFNGIRGVARVLRKKAPVSIVNIASVSGLTAWPYASAYCVSKAGVLHLTRVAALEYAKEGLRINSVSPGTFPTAIHADLPEQVLADLDAKHPMGLGTPGDIVGAVTFLAGDDSRWMTGQTIVVDGGYSLP